MSNTIAVNVVADVRNINKGIQNVNQQLSGLQRTTQRISGIFKTAVGGMAAAFAGGKVVGFLRDSITAGSDLNETISKTQTIFGDATPELLKFADTASTALGQSRNEALTGLSTFGNFFNQIGIGTKQSAAMSKGFVQMATDLASFNNAAPVDVMDALSSATRGEYDALQKYIPTINAAAVQNEALRETHKKSVKNLTAAEQATALYNLALKGQGKAAGDFARTSGGLANQQRILTAQFHDAQAAIGTALLPVMTTLVTFVNTTAIPAIKSLVGFVGDNKSVILGLAAAVGALFAVQKLHTAFMAVQAVGGLVAYVAQMNVVQVLTRTWTAVQWLLNAALSANPIGLVIAAVAALIAVIVLAWKNSETFRTVVITAWNAIKAATVAVWNFITNLLRTVWNALKTAGSAVFNFLKSLVTGTWNGIKSITSSVWNGIKSIVSGVLSFLGGLVSRAVGSIGRSISGAWNAAKSLTTSAWNGMKSAVSGAIDGIINFVSGIKNKVTGALSGIGSWLFDHGKNLLQGMINGLQSMGRNLANAALAPVKKAVNAVKSFLHIGSPSKLFRQYGIWTNEGLAIGLQETAGVKRAATGLAKVVADGFEPKLSMTADVTASRTGAGNTYNLNVTVAPGSNPAEVGRQIINSIKEYERQSGSGWRR